jgi:hypothetical protein
MQCRRCRRNVELDAKVCEYCDLENPTQVAKSVRLEQVAEAEEQRQRSQKTVLVAAISILVIAVAFGLYWRSRSEAQAEAQAAQVAATAPLCGDAQVGQGVITLLLENALRDVEPVVSEKYGADRFTITGVSEQVSKDVTQVRNCTAALFHKPSAESQAFIRGYLDNSQALLDRDISESDIATGTAFLRNTWHASVQQLEMSLPFEIARDPDDVNHGWTINFNAFQQTNLDQARAGLYLMIVGSEAGGAADR